MTNQFMRFLADMGIAVEVVATLRSEGHDAVHLHEQGLHRLPDDRILQKAVDEERVLLTHDLDFSRLAALLRTPMPSIVSFRLRRMTPINVTQHLRGVLDRWRGELLTGALISVRDGAARCRRMPWIYDVRSSEDQGGTNDS